MPIVVRIPNRLANGWSINLPILSYGNFAVDQQNSEKSHRKDLIQKIIPSKFLPKTGHK